MNIVDGLFQELQRAKELLECYDVLPTDSNDTIEMKSKKTDKLFLVYKVLRCTMDDEDVKGLLSLYPDFKELTDTSIDCDIIEACCHIAEAMNTEFECNMNSDTLSKIGDNHD